jgi:hypothetical protein
MNHGNNMPFNVAMLETDPNLAVDFIIDNNPEEVQAHLSGLNLLSVAPQNATVPLIKKDVRRISDAETLQEVLTVPYVNENPNYTGGYESELSVSPYGLNKAAGAGVAIVQGISTLGSSIANIFISQNQEDLAAIQGQTAYEQALINQQINQANIEAGKTFGIPTTAFLAIIGAMVALVAIVLFSTKD